MAKASLTLTRLPGRYSLAFLVSLACQATVVTNTTFRSILFSLDEAVVQLTRQPGTPQLELLQAAQSYFQADNPIVDIATGNWLRSHVLSIAALLVCACPGFRANDRLLLALFNDEQILLILEVVFQIRER